jgi:hypothetical protein
MTLAIPPGFAQAAYHFSLVGDPEEMVTTMGYEISNAGSAQTLANSLADGFTNTVFPVAIMSDQATFKGVKLRVGQDGGPPVIVEAPRNVPGTSGQGYPTQNVAILFRKTTGLGGRRGRGRCYLPPFWVKESEVAPNGVMTTAQVDMLQGCADRWFALGSPVLLHEQGPVGTPPPTPLTGIVADPSVATQRRRLRR